MLLINCSNVFCTVLFFFLPSQSFLPYTTSQNLTVSWESLKKNSKVNLDTFFLLSTNFSFLNYVNSLVCVNLLINCSNFHAMHYQVFVLNEKFYFL